MPFSDDEQILIETKSKVKPFILAISIALFLLALINPSYCTKSVCVDNSIMPFLLGWFALLSGSAGISWIANPLILIAWILLIKNKKSTWIFSLLASIACLSFLLFNSILVNEAGHFETILKIGIGY